MLQTFILRNNITWWLFIKTYFISIIILSHIDDGYTEIGMNLTGVGKEYFTRIGPDESQWSRRSRLS
jgi:hypothetical protein